jgi:hypothetical protein
VDWFEAVAKLDGEPCKLQFFAMRSMASVPDTELEFLAHAGAVK